MLIEICNNIFESDDNFKNINVLIQSITYKWKHDLFIDINYLKDNVLFNRLDKGDIDIIKMSHDKVVTESGKPDYFVSTSDDDYYSLDEIIRIIGDPCFLILENSLNDSYFIDSILLNFKKVSQKIKKHMSEGWLKYENGGGLDNITNVIEGKLKCYDHLPKANYKYLRCIVIVDSDKKYPEMPTENNTYLQTYLVQKEIPFHILEKREMENYLPDVVIEEIADQENDNCLKAYLKLSPIQKDYFDFERGFKNKNYNSLNENVKSLYSDVRDEDYKFLRVGVHCDRYKNKMKKEFPKLFTHPKVDQTNLINRVMYQKDKNELQAIIIKIGELL